MFFTLRPTNGHSLPVKKIEKGFLNWQTRPIGLPRLLAKTIERKGLYAGRCAAWPARGKRKEREKKGKERRETGH